MADDAVQMGDAVIEHAMDPFGLVPDWTSKIAGLGGPEPARDGNYVFHTVYAPVAEGHAHFRVRFNGLRGKLGTLVLRVHFYQKGAKDARLAVSERILLSRLIQLGGTYDIRFEAFHSVTYALFASMDGLSDAAADSVEVVLDRPGDANEPNLPATEARNSDFGRGAVQAAPSIIAIARATLADPVSQRCTASQCTEPAFRNWSQRLRRPSAHLLDRWCEVYVLQVLTRYGRLLPGAAGLGIGAGGSGVAALAAQAGASIQVADGDTDEDAATVRLRGSVSGTRFDENAIRYRTAEPAALPRDLVNLDFLWSEWVGSRLGSAAEGVHFADRAMAHLRPGGLAVHVVDFALEDGDDVGAHSTAWRRRELDRLALILISRGHDVAEIKVDERRSPLRDEYRGAGSERITAAGLIVRKARTIE